MSNHSPGTYLPGHKPSWELTTSRPISIYDLFEPYIDVLASTTPTTRYYKVPYFYLTSLRLRDLPGPPRNPLKGHHLFAPATTRSFLSLVAVPVAPFELQPAPSTLQHKPSYTKPYLKTYSDPGLTLPPPPLPCREDGVISVEEVEDTDADNEDDEDGDNEHDEDEDNKDKDDGLHHRYHSSPLNVAQTMEGWSLPTSSSLTVADIDSASPTFLGSSSSSTPTPDSASPISTNANSGSNAAFTDAGSVPTTDLSGHCLHHLHHSHNYRLYHFRLTAG
ncbi:hypothetical protein F5051DRAFT_487815 [Lentinula edodes]|nr:hypothetical protein F5051DRAFT_487815 [Lentinula edodes]